MSKENITIPDYEFALHNIEKAMQDDSDSCDLRYSRAVILEALGRDEIAKQAYLDILLQYPNHSNQARVLNSLGVMANRNGSRTAAILAFTEALKYAPAEIAPHFNLGNIYLASGNFAEAKAHYCAILKQDPEHCDAHQGLSYVYMYQGQFDLAHEHQRRGFATRSVALLPYRGTGKPISILALFSATPGNTPIQKHIDDHIFQVHALYVEYFDLAQPLPPHDMVFNAIGDADLCESALTKAISLLEQTRAPVLNHPNFILKTSRMANAERFSHLPNAISAKIQSFTRTQLSTEDIADTLANNGFQFPLLIRAPGHHTGKFFEHVQNIDMFASVVDQLPGNELMLMQFLDTRSADGKCRKYRVMMINGQLYPLHVAIGTNWKIHYFSADMLENEAHRAEEAAFLTNMSNVLGDQIMQTLQTIQDLLQLDYAGIDFGINPAGKLVIFEINAVMIVTPVDPKPQWNYRIAPVNNILLAIRQLLSQCASML